ncbi:hypothetical protein BBK36DRAFT_23498 [Trichoderma citrinoviride]|uniref:Uncharacterized protein n=1 Tax=Trichoderma citrinoviride TaxID=58853 RepID=A0A2T4B085_9HYPO|nr:hypothetical protein BBK36DRAFT_23498 [Trichoderma citrinoviride]PTB62732.1 hypothetical protein BBK36DRAFT_23498 [Trichoderma citrinoviride]
MLLKKYLKSVWQATIRHEQGILSNTELDQRKLEQTQYLHEFDRAIQKPLWNYPTETVYYREASSVNPLLSVRIPLLAYNSEDDPLSPQIGLPIEEEAKENPYVVLVVTSFGGHLGWFQPGGGRWCVQAVYNTLQQFWDCTGHGGPCKRFKVLNRSQISHAQGRFCYECRKYCTQIY